MQTYFYLNILVSAIILCISHAQDLVIELVNPKGKIQGHVMQSRDKQDFYAFQEIPYAAPPVGKNRFQPPQNPDGWDGIRDATKNTKVCIQFPLEPFMDFLGPNFHNVTEDCLYLNVYAPVKHGSNNGSLLPVLAWIHGGASVIGDGAIESYGPEFLIDHGIIIVTLNYRLGPLGFLTTQDGVIPGNLALKDQNFALKWIAQNIELFGGNASEVTIMGESSGATNVGAHLVGRKDGLFRGAIIQSGSSICTWVYTEDAKYYAYEMGRQLDESFKNNSEDLLNILLAASTDDIIEASRHVVSIEGMTGGLGDFIWTGVIESENETDAFITKPMYSSLLSGDYNTVPILLGHNSEEAKTFLALRASEIPTLAGQLDANVSSIVSQKINMDSQSRYQAGIRIRKTYCQNSTFSENLNCFIKISGDVKFKMPVIRQADVSSRYAPVYLYQLSIESTLSSLLSSLMDNNNITNVYGVGHGEDLFYLWHASVVSDLVSLVSPYALRTSHRMTKMWTNFVKYQNPTPEKDEMLDNVLWPMAQPNNVQYLDIDESLEIRSNPEHYKEIDDILNEYAQPPYVVYW